MWTEIVNFFSELFDKLLDPVTNGIVGQIFEFIKGLFA